MIKFDGSAFVLLAALTPGANPSHDILIVVQLHLYQILFLLCFYSINTRRLIFNF